MRRFYLVEEVGISSSWHPSKGVNLEGRIIELTDRIGSSVSEDIYPQAKGWCSAKFRILDKEKMKKFGEPNHFCCSFKLKKIPSKRVIPYLL